MLTEALKQTINATYKRVGETMAGFRRRRSQPMMIAAIARGLTSPAKACAVEAPTGTGKSLSYLVGAHAVAQDNQKKLLIVTATLQLQEQLLSKDVAAYLAASGISANVCVAKGRSRWACPRNMQQLTSNDDAQAALDLGEDAVSAVWPRKPRKGEPEKIARLFALLMDRKWNGDLDAPPETIDADLMPLLSTTTGGCSNAACKFYQGCPFVNARRAVREADIIVANQNLLIADIMMKRNGEEDSSGGVVLPPPQDCFVVVDEAHHLGPKAIEQGAARVHLSSAIKALGKCAGPARAAYACAGKQTIATLSLNEGLAHVEDLRKQLVAMQEMVRAAWPPDDKTMQWRATQGQIPDAWRDLAENLRIESGLLVKWFRAMRRLVHESASMAEALRERLGRELGIVQERIEAQAELWRLWAATDEESRAPRARWVTMAQDRTIQCHACGVSAAGLLRKRLFEKAAGVVLTSATLSAGGDFSWLGHSVGLPEDAECVSLPSPFDLPNQATVVIPALQALPGDFDGHVKEIADWLERKLPWAAGNLVIFTSKAKLDAVYAKLSPEHAECVLVQGVRSRAATLAEHKQRVGAGQGSTLFGLASMGEGIDLQGDLLSTCVITQIPFARPDDPVGATYAEWLESQNRNPFAEVSIPEATRLLVQYAGRLVRTETDTGQIVILDRRLVRQRYGKRMLNALPPYRRVIEPVPMATATHQETGQ